MGSDLAWRNGQGTHGGWADWEWWWGRGATAAG
jgi:hypothetical protein